MGCVNRNHRGSARIGANLSSLGIASFFPSSPAGLIKCEPFALASGVEGVGWRIAIRWTKSLRVRFLFRVHSVYFCGHRQLLGNHQTSATEETRTPHGMWRVLWSGPSDCCRSWNSRFSITSRQWHMIKRLSEKLHCFFSNFNRHFIDDLRFMR